MAEKENRRRQMTKRLLRTALLELMQEKPVSGITIRELCARADLNRTTFYLHYTDQMDLLRDIEQDMLEKTKEAMRDIHTEPHTTLLVQAFLNYVRENDLAFRTLFARDDSEHFRRAFVAEMRTVLGPNLPDYDHVGVPEYVLSFLMYGTLYVVIEWMENGYRESTEEISKLIYQLCGSIG